MRKNLLRADRELLAYPIREIALEAQYIAELSGRTIVWENIGDPIAQGERMPEWARQHIEKALKNPMTYAYTDTRGDRDARMFVHAQLPGNVICDPDKDILFFNGLGEAINRIFNNLPEDARVLVPSPTYPTHATAEAVHAKKKFLSYPLIPEKEWAPDIEVIEKLIKDNKDITAILVINPNNPTGAVFTRSSLEQIIDIARRYDLFVIFDEIYQHLVYDKRDTVLLAEIIGSDVPGIAMKGISKDIPWPGARCGWIELYNADCDKNFRAFSDMLLLSKMLEVCSTTLPQKVFPHILSDVQFGAHLACRIDKYRRRADEIKKVLGALPMVRFVQPKGVFYAVIELLDLASDGRVAMQDDAIRTHVNLLHAKGTPAPDEHFVYELMGAKNICVVPLTGFGSERNGFRMTLLQEDDDIFTRTLINIKDVILAYYDKV